MIIVLNFFIVLSDSRKVKLSISGVLPIIDNLSEPTQHIGQRTIIGANCLTQQQVSDLLVGNAYFFVIQFILVRKTTF